MTDRVGQQLGNYTLVRLLGQGGFAEVYEGEHIVLKQKRAIKILHTTLTEQESHGFRIEAERLARLTHPHIVPIVDFDEREGFPYLVMEYAPHGSLRNRHPKGTRVPLPTIFDYIKQIAPALQYIHDQKLIHRDIKPENMLIGANNRVLLSDIGLAEVAHSEQSRPTQNIDGTPHYMAPEQFKGKAEPASDQYSLGVVVYEWLSGKRPFEEGGSLQLHYQHTYAPPRSLREIVPTIPAAIEDTVMIALAKDPKRRFANIQSFATALENESKPKTSQLPPFQPAPAQPQQFTPTVPQVQTLYSVRNAEPVKSQPIPVQPIDKDALYRAGFVAQSNGKLNHAASLWKQILDVDRGYGNGTLAFQMQKLGREILVRDTQRLRQQAKEAQKKGNLEQEKNLWQSLLQLVPKDKEALASIENLIRQTARKAQQTKNKKQEKQAWSDLLHWKKQDKEAQRHLEKLTKQEIRIARHSGNWQQEIQLLRELEALLFPNEKQTLFLSFPNEKQTLVRDAIQIATKNKKYEWMYDNAVRLIEERNFDAGKKLIRDLWNTCPRYGDPKNIAHIVGMHAPKVNSLHWKSHEITTICIFTILILFFIFFFIFFFIHHYAFGFLIVCLVLILCFVFRVALIIRGKLRSVI